MPKQYLECGKIVTTHALKGEVKIQPWCDAPQFLCEFKAFYTNKDGTAQIKATSVRANGNMVIAKFENVDSIEQAVMLRGKVLYINRDDAMLEDGDFFVQDLIGLKVMDSEDFGKVYGELVEVSQTGANDVYHIKNGEKIYLIPAIKKVVISTDLQKGEMLIKPIKGLFDDDYVTDLDEDEKI